MTENIVIVGGGIIGVSTAFFLSRHQLVKGGLYNVTIVEANDIASGASGKAGGFLALDWHDPRTASLARLSYALYQDLAGEFDGDTVFGYGQLQSFSLKKSTESAKDTLAAHIHQFRLQPPSLGTAALDAVGWLQDVRVQSLDVISKEDTTAQVNPAAFTRTLFHESQKAGVTYCHGRATSLNEETKTLNVFTSDGEIQIPIDKLIITCGPWSGKVAKKLLNLDIPISYLPGHSILIRPSESVPPQAIFSQILGENMSLSPEIFVWRNGMVYVAGENNGPPLPDGTSSVKVDPTAIDKLINASKELSSLLANGAIEVQQLCYRPITSQGVPLIGKLRSGSVKAFIAAGHGPWGITLGPGTGKAMTELVLDGQTVSCDISALDPSRIIGTLY